MTTTETTAWWRDLPPDVIEDSPMLYVDGVLVNVVEALAARADASAREVADIRAVLVDYRDRAMRTRDNFDDMPSQERYHFGRYAAFCDALMALDDSTTGQAAARAEASAREVERLREALQEIAALCQAFPIEPGMPSESFDPDAIADIALAVLAVKEES